MTLPELSICILTLNSRDYLRECLESIRQYPPKGGYEILVADNGSDDGTPAMLHAEFPELKAILNE